MKLYLTLFAFTISALVAGAPRTSAAPEAGGAKAQERAARKAQDSERAVKMKDLPAAVQQTVREQSRGAVIRGLAEETENGVTNYEVELRVKGHTRDVLIDPSGNVVAVEEQVTLASLPAAVKTTVEQNRAGGRILLVESISKGGVVEAYEVHVKRAGKTREIKIGPDGQLLPEG